MFSSSLKPAPCVTAFSRRSILSYCAVAMCLFPSAGCSAPVTVQTTPSTAAAKEIWPRPLIGWNASVGNSTRATTPLMPGVDTLRGIGSDPALNTLQIISNDNSKGVASKVSWLRPAKEPAALALSQPYSGANENAILQSGDEKAPLGQINGRQLAFFIEFKLTGSMSETGNPKAEEDGYLLTLGPDVSLMIAGRGREGKARRLPSLRVKEKTVAGENSECTYTLKLDDELHLGQWYRLGVSYDGGQTPEKRVMMALNGATRAVTVKGHSAAAPVTLNPSGPLRIAGNRGWNNTPIHLGAFAVYAEAIPAAQLGQLSRAVLTAAPGQTANTIRELPQYEKLANLNKVAAWATPPTPLAVEEVSNDILRVSLADTKFRDTRTLLLKAPIALDTGIKSVNFWICQPPGGRGGFSMMPVFANAKGDEIDGAGMLYLSEHSMPPNSRKAGLWFYRFADIPGGARKFIGFKFKPENGERTNDPTDTVFIKDIGLERIDYARAGLYYVVGNFRDNFSDTTYNSMGARALTESSGDAAVPYILLDNLIDQTKQNRPKSVDLQIEAYNTADRRIWVESLNKIPAEGVPDFARRITVPITQPGTYRIRGKSYDSATGAYFTTDWTKLVVIKGKAQQLQPKAQGSLLAINATRPFGRLEKTDPRQITFSFNAEAFKSRPGPLSLRYAVVPYEEVAPRHNAKRDVPLAITRDLSAVAPVTVAYEPKRTAELVIAELWQNGKCIDREERPIGIANTIDKAPAFTLAPKVPTLDDLAGKGQIWRTLTIVSNPGDDPLQDMKRNIKEARKLTPDLGFAPDMKRLVPMPGVYDWDSLQPYFDLAAENGCRVILYLNQKWPPEWAPVEWASDGSGQVHRAGHLYAYMVGKSLYATGEHGPRIIRDFNRQLARRFLNHPGFGGYYFENEHLDIQWEKHPATRSYHETYRRGFARFAEKRYGTLAKLNAAYGTSYTAFDQVRLPDGDNQAEFPKRQTFVDFRLFQREEVEKFVLRDQFDVARAEDPRRPIIVYGIGEESYDFLNHVARGGGIMANGGVHSHFPVDADYERVNAVPGLRFRMEPHDVTNYDPIPHGFDEMIFGMLATGGRGLHEHIFLHGWKNFDYEKALIPGQRTGFDKLIQADPMLRELRDAEKLHDPIGLVELRSQGPYEGGIWAFHAASYAASHFNPRMVHAEGNLNYLDGSKLICIARNTIDAGQMAYLDKFVRGGGKLVMEWNAARFALEKLDTPGKNALLDSMGVDFLAEGTKLPGVSLTHDVYKVGQGEILVARGAPTPELWEAAMPALVKWAGIAERLANTSNRHLQIHVLQRGDVYYLATTHRGQNQGFGDGPKNWNGKVQFLKPLAGTRYRVTEMMSGKPVGEFTSEQLAAGFEAGNYNELQMKIFKIERG